MRLPGVKTAKKVSRWLRARVLGGALILGYHSISAPKDDVYEVCVSPENFSVQMEALSKHARLISLSRLVQSLRQNLLPPKSVAVTFDDGYVDNLHVAKPILEKYAIPATVFICTGYLGREFWWDELERLVMSSHTDLRTLQLQVGGKQFDWHATIVSPGAGHRASRHEFCRALYQFLLSLDVEEQNRAMGLIRSWSDVSSLGTSTPRAMNEEELLRLVDGGLIELGAHTRHHPMLPQLPFRRQREEIVSSKQDLESLLGRRVDGFAYPNGTVTDDAKRIVREAGFMFACTSLHNVVRPESNLYELMRFWQRDVDGDRFLRGLKTWM